MEQRQVGPRFRRRGHPSELLWVAKFSHAVPEGFYLSRCRQRAVPSGPQTPDGHPGQVAEDDAAHIAEGGSAARRRELRQILVHDLNQPFGRLEQPGS